MRVSGTVILGGIFILAFGALAMFIIAINGDIYDVEQDIEGLEGRVKAIEAAHPIELDETWDPQRTDWGWHIWLLDDLPNEEESP